MKAFPNRDGDTVYDNGCENKEVVDGDYHSIESATIRTDDAERY